MMRLFWHMPIRWWIASCIYMGLRRVHEPAAAAFSDALGLTRVLRAMLAHEPLPASRPYVWLLLKAFRALNALHAETAERFAQRTGLTAALQALEQHLERSKPV